MPVPPSRPSRLRALAAAGLLSLTAFAGACNDPTRLRARFENLSYDLTVWAMTGTPESFPAAVLVPQRQVTRPDGSGAFDIAFDINPQGQVVLLPVDLVVAPVGGARRIGFQRVTGSFAALEAAPKSGWVYDSAFTWQRGETIAMRIQSVYCQFDVAQEIYAKFVLDSVIPAERRMVLRGFINPNCGFRSFATGLPSF